MRILVAGASGFVGRALLAEAGRAQLGQLVLLRRESSAFQPAPSASAHTVLAWNPERGEIPPHCIDDVDTIVNLCGAGIADARWSASRRRELRDSRILATRTLVGALACATPRPRVLINASAIGYHGDCGEAVVREDSPQGDGFLAGLCADWESEAMAARLSGVRVVTLRFGVVLGSGGGLYARLAPLYRLGLGGRLGDGRAWMAWISLSDLVRAILHLASSPGIEGPVLAVAPSPVRAAAFSKMLAQSLRRPAFLPVPAALLRLAFGRMADELFLSSCRAEPDRLSSSGFVFHDTDLATCLSRLSMT